MPLIPVDSARLRQEAKGEYDEVVRDLEKARLELDRFHQHDVPSFTRWISSTFGSLLTEIRETTQHLQEKQTLLYEIEREVMYTGISHDSAYERVMQRRQKQQEQSEKDLDEDDEEEKASKEEDDWFEFDDLNFEPDFENGSWGSKPSGKHPGQERLSEPTVARLKELYRAVVRRLHPDTQKELTPKKVELWHQAQAAYEARNIEQLEVILSLCEIEDAGSAEKASLWVMKKIIQQFRSSLRQVRHQIASCRLDPAWNFSKRKETADLAKTIKRRLTQDLRMIKDELGWIEEQLAAIAASAQKMRRRPVYARRRSKSPFDFF